MATSVAGRGFLDLPLEIRLHIYRNLFDFRSTTIDAHRLQNDGPGYKLHFAIDIEDRSSQFLRTCRTIWTEAEAVFYEYTTFSLSRHVDWFVYLQTAPRLRPQVTKIRHLEIDIRPEKVQDVPNNFFELRKHIRAARLELLTDVKLTCHAVEWLVTSLVTTDRIRIRTPFETAHDVLELMGYAFLKGTAMNCMEDKSKDGLRVVFQLSMIALPARISSRKTVTGT